MLRRGPARAEDKRLLARELLRCPGEAAPSPPYGAVAADMLLNAASHGPARQCLHFLGQVRACEGRAAFRAMIIVVLQRLWVEIWRMGLMGGLAWLRVNSFYRMMY